MKKDKTVSQSFISGIIAGITDVAITHPLWTIQVLYQDGISKSNILNSIKKIQVFYIVEYYKMLGLLYL